MSNHEVLCHVGLKRRLCSTVAVKSPLVNHIFIVAACLTRTGYTETDLEAE